MTQGYSPPATALYVALPFEKGTLEIEHNNSYNQFEVQ